MNDRLEAAIWTSSSIPTRIAHKTQKYQFGLERNWCVKYGYEGISRMGGKETVKFKVLALLCINRKPKQPQAEAPTLTPTGKP